MQTPLTVLQHTFKLAGFRPGQQAVIDSLLHGRSSLAVFPTGGGKSLCYQLPALIFDGLTLIVSPLIALMKDQVDALHALGIPAARMDSSLAKDEVQRLYHEIQNGETKILYVSPERLKNERFVQRLAQVKISLMAVDEAHCISEWGHNFRPDYLTLAKLAEQLRVERILALTATATPAVAADICKQFAIQPQDHIQTSFARPNLQLRITPSSATDRMRLLLARLQQHPTDAATIIYVTLQKTAEEVAAAINAAEMRAAFYHAGLKDEERSRIQNDFMNGEVPIVVATIAFGMGIDKSNIRAVYHFNLPKSIENYVQEIGRAGRDGLPSLCEMFAVGDDVRVLENFTYGDTPSRENLAALLQQLLSDNDIFDISTYELSHHFDIRRLVLSTALTYLELDGIIAATGTFYTEYKIHFLRSPAEIAAQFSGERAEFLKRLFAAGREGRKWLTLDMLTIETVLQEPKIRVTKALEYLKEQGWIELTVANARQGYRQLKSADLPHTLNKLMALFEQREQKDIQRIQQVVNYINNAACLSTQLLTYFGEQSDQPCGNCSHCRSGYRAMHVPEPTQDLSDDQLEIVAGLRAERHSALEHPRQLARFLCGLPSPATARNKLRQHPGFGALSIHNFATVLTIVSKLSEA